ncbi:MAG: hypothetical protein OHK0039_34870 [Bacteroidia bacterium]
MSQTIRHTLCVCLLLTSSLGLSARPQLSFFTEVEGEVLQQMLLDSALIRDLQAMQASLRVGLIDLDEARADAILRLNRAGIPVVAWLLLPSEAGYWFHADNGEAARQRYHDFQAWSTRYGLQWVGVGIDLEPPIADVRKLREAPLRLAFEMLGRLYDAQGLAASERIYLDLIKEMQDDGYRVESYIFPPILDERQAGTQSFQRLTRILDIRTDAEIPMCYTSAGIGGPAMILSYGGEAGRVAIGSTGGGIILGDGQELPALTWEALGRDLLLAQQVSAEVHIFSLEGCLRQGWLAGIRDFDFSQPVSLYSGEIRRQEDLRTRVRNVLHVLSYPSLLLLAVGIVLLLLLYLLWQAATWPLRRKRRRRAAQEDLGG